jgi:calcineurin-like phosphoesterase family protein
VSRAWFTADPHYGHENIIAHARRPFADLAEMEAALISRWNSRVKKGDCVYIVGDFALTSPEETLRILKQLNGQKYLVRGNHDGPMKGELAKAFVWIKDMATVRVKDPTAPRGRQLIVLCHYALRVWKESHYGSWHLYGHCVDGETEILTDGGWKRWEEVGVGDPLPSYNHQTGEIETDRVEEVLVFPDYSGEVCTFKGKSVDLRVTAGHTFIRFSRDGRQMYEEPASTFFKRKRAVVRRCGVRPRSGLLLSDALLKVWILLAADGNIKESTGLARIHLWKERKKVYVREVLTAAGFAWKELVQADRSSSFNFYVPEELGGYRIKGLDRKLLQVSPRQFQVILEAYRYSDGRAVGKGTLIWTSKEREADLLQALAVQSGYGVTKLCRPGTGFSSRPSYQLSIFPADVQVLPNVGGRVEWEQVEEELFWCIRCRNRNFFMRRGGKVHLTGNSHGSLPDLPTSRSFDVGVDCWDFAPISYAEVGQRMALKTWAPVDHHKAKEVRETP